MVEWKAFYIFFVSDGYHYLFYANRNDDVRWLNANNYGHADNVWNGNNVFVFRRPRNSFHFSPALAGEFCFMICPCHPPSIFPISSIGKDIAIYFLLSNDFVSQRTINNIFSVYNFLIATLIHGCFSSFDKKLATDIASIISTNRLSILCPKDRLCSFGKI